MKFLWYMFCYFLLSIICVPFKVLSSVFTIIVSVFHFPKEIMKEKIKDLKPESNETIETPKSERNNEGFKIDSPLMKVFKSKDNGKS